MSTTKIDRALMKYCTIKQYMDMYSIKIDDDTETFMTNTKSKFAKKTLDEKNFYMTYSLSIVDTLNKNFKKPNKIIVNSDTEDKAAMKYDLLLTHKKDKTIPISFDYNSLAINNILANKFMKICGFRRNTTIYKTYKAEYDKINDKVYNKIKSKESFTDLSEKTLMKTVYDPFTALLAATLTLKRKCSTELFNAIYEECPRVIIKLMKSRFVVYDFTEYNYQPNGFSLKKIEKTNNQLLLKYKKYTDESGNKIDGPIFLLTLTKNSQKIKPQLSLKYNITMENMDKLFLMADTKVSFDKKRKTSTSKTNKKAPAKKSSKKSSKKSRKEAKQDA